MANILIHGRDIMDTTVVVLSAAGTASIHPPSLFVLCHWFIMEMEESRIWALKQFRPTDVSSLIKNILSSDITEYKHSSCTGDRHDIGNFGKRSPRMVP